jgi:hypothetical protein
MPRDFGKFLGCSGPGPSLRCTKWEQRFNGFLDEHLKIDSLCVIFLRKVVRLGNSLVKVMD